MFTLRYKPAPDNVTSPDYDASRIGAALAVMVWEVNFLVTDLLCERYLPRGIAAWPWCRRHSQPQVRILLSGAVRT